MKGINLAMYLVLAVILIGVGIVFYTKIRGWSCVSDPFSCGGKKSDLEAAAECVMAVCYHGCESPQVKSIKGESFDCNSYCEQNQELVNFIYNSGNNPGRFCGFQFPIKIEIPEGKTMRVDKKTISQDYQCFFKFDGSLDSIKNMINAWSKVSYKSLGVKDFGDSTYFETKKFPCLPPLKEIDGFEIKGKKTLYVYGDIMPFVAEDGIIFSAITFPITFITDDVFYHDIRVNEEKKITLKFREYYPLEKNYGIIIRDAVYPSKTCGDTYEPNDKDNDKCDFNYWKVCLDAFCNGKIENKEVCITNERNELELDICGKYKIKPLSLPSFPENKVSDVSGRFTPYTFSVYRVN